MESTTFGTKVMYFRLKNARILQNIELSFFFFKFIANEVASNSNSNNNQRVFIEGLVCVLCNALKPVGADTDFICHCYPL